MNQIKVVVCSVVKVNIKTKTINRVAKSVTLAGTMTAQVKAVAKTIAVLDRTLTPTKVRV